MMEPFLELGAFVERAWAQANYDELLLPQIAHGALEIARIPERVLGLDVIRWLLQTPSLPPQEDLRATFGQPPITVFRGRRFHVQVLFWMNGSTTIHRHGFSGAFQVLDGGSLHSRWKFSPRRRITSHMLLGEVALLGAEVLERGAIVRITNDLTHGLFHLEAPSATIVVRSHGEIESGPQYEYHPPFVAIDPFFVDPVMTRRLQALRLLRAANQIEYVDLAQNLIANADLQTVFCVLEQSQHETTDMALLETLSNAGRERHGLLIDEFVAAVREGSRRRALHALRRDIRDPDQRFFLALLQNLPDRESIDQLLGERFGAVNLREKLWSLLDALSGTSRIGVDTSGELERILVDSLLDGDDEKALFMKLAETFDAESIEETRMDVIAHAARIRRTLLAPLFLRSGS